MLHAHYLIDIRSEKEVCERVPSSGPAERAARPGEPEDPARAAPHPNDPVQISPKAQRVRLSQSRPSLHPPRPTKALIFTSPVKIAFKSYDSQIFSKFSPNPSHPLQVGAGKVLSCLVNNKTKIQQKAEGPGHTKDDEVCWQEVQILVRNGCNSLIRSALPSSILYNSNNCNFNESLPFNRLKTNNKLQQPPNLNLHLRSKPHPPSSKPSPPPPPSPSANPVNRKSPSFAKTKFQKREKYIRVW